MQLMYTHGIRHGQAAIFKDGKNMTLDHAIQRLNEIETLQQEIIELRTKLSPWMWTEAMNVAWHRNLPNVGRSFQALQEV